MTNEERDRMLQATHDSVIRIEERCKACHEDVEDHGTTLYDPITGLKQRVTVVETLTKGESARGRRWTSWLLSVASGLIGAISVWAAEKFSK